MTRHTPPSARVNGMINDLVHDRNNARATVRDQGLPALLEAYGLSDAEKAAFRQPSWQSLGAIGVAPVHQILFALQVSPDARAHLTWRAHESRFETEVRQPALARQQQKDTSHG